MSKNEQKLDVNKSEVDLKLTKLPPLASSGPYIPTGPGDIFLNETFKKAFDSLSESDKDKYRQIGKDMYETLNFQTGELYDNNGNVPLPMVDAVLHIKNQLDSGLHPSLLDNNEKRVMSEIEGNTWYTKWGYIEEDLDTIVTVKFN